MAEPDSEKDQAPSSTEQDEYNRLDHATFRKSKEPKDSDEIDV